MQGIIGIDLGTTNTTMAYRLPHQSATEQFPTMQQITQDLQEEHLILPSFLYFPLASEGMEQPFYVGTWARNRGAEVPDRVISSAKSWLCHASVNCRESFLPLHSEGPHLSPLQVSAEYLSHLRKAWDSHFPDLPFAQQSILITVPASFDPNARQLVQEAAQLAGYPEVVLLEEPQAAFYAWLQQHEDIWRHELSVGDRVLVVDIGGGTTDFSLISVEQEEGALALKRLAVGDHLLLGGDNIDLSLAYLAKSKLDEAGHAIDEWQMQSLVHACRQAKERLFSENHPEQVDISILGRGSKLIGGSLKTSISHDEARQLIIDGFFPLVSFEDQTKEERPVGLQQVGLPYAQDPRISCQLAKFLALAGKGLPTALLFNGGTTKAAAIRSRLIEQLNAWAQQEGATPIKVLEAPDYDFAVSRGAVCYGLARQGKAIRIRSGLSRSFFIGIEDSLPAVPGVPRRMRALCIAPHGMEEGTEGELPHKEFSLLVGEPATFRFFSCNSPELPDGTTAQCGSLLANTNQLQELHPIETILDRKEGDGKTIRIKLKSRVTELGMLELSCVSEDNRSWKLEFGVRD